MQSVVLYGTFLFHLSPFVWIAIILYLAMAYFLFRQWVFLFLEDQEMSANQRSISRILLGISTIIWPIIVPVAYLALLNVHIKYKKQIAFLIHQAHTRMNDDELRN